MNRHMNPKHSSKRRQALLFVALCIAIGPALGAQNVIDPTPFLDAVARYQPGMTAVIDKARKEDSNNHSTITDLLSDYSADRAVKAWRDAVSKAEDSIFELPLSAVSVTPGKKDVAAGTRMFTLKSSDPFLSYNGTEAFWDSDSADAAIASGTLSARIYYRLHVETERGFRWKIDSLVLSIWRGQEFLASQSVRDSGSFTLDTRRSVVQRVFMQMELVPGGTFTTEKGSKVTLSDFYMAATLCTQRQYQELMGINPSSNKEQEDAADCPVVNVSWFDALEFCNALSRREGLQPYYTIKYTKATINPGANGYRLPTDAEWECAARGGAVVAATQTVPTSSRGTDATAWLAGNSGNRAHPVGTKAANNLGLFDIFGNAFEWCYDWYGRGTKEGVNPVGPAEGSKRILRGGFWGQNNLGGATDSVGYANPDTRADSMSFRVARSYSAGE